MVQKIDVMVILRSQINTALDNRRYQRAGELINELARLQGARDAAAQAERDALEELE